MRHALILAGGSGRRFWPQSRRRRPKQALPIAGGRSFLAAARDRIEPLADAVWVCTGRDQLEALEPLLPDLPTERWIVEPAPRDTAAAVGLGLSRIRRSDPDAEVWVLPADQAIPSESSFRTTMEEALDVAGQDGVEIVVVGIPPRSASSRFGYLQPGTAIPGTTGRRVEAYVEKPSEDRARNLVEEGWLWNGGMFAGRVDRFLAAISEEMPVLADLLDEAEGMAPEAFAGAGEELAERFRPLPRRSLDHGVMEARAVKGRVAMVTGTFDWLDVGSWEAIAELFPRDESGNVALGRTLSLETTESIIVSTEDHLVGTIGLENVVVVHTRDATLVCDRGSLGRLKEFLENADEDVL